MGLLACTTSSVRDIFTFAVFCSVTRFCPRVPDHKSSYKVASPGESIGKGFTKPAAADLGLWEGMPVGTALHMLWNWVRVHIIDRISNSLTAAVNIIGW